MVDASLRPVAGAGDADHQRLDAASVVAAAADFGLMLLRQRGVLRGLVQSDMVREEVRVSGREAAHQRLALGRIELPADHRIAAAGRGGGFLRRRCHAFSTVRGRAGSGQAQSGSAVGARNSRLTSGWRARTCSPILAMTRSTSPAGTSSLKSTAA